MAASDVERARHALEKGAILRVLQDAYGGPAMTLSGLASVLDNLGFPMSPIGLQFALTYLGDTGFARVVKAKDLPGFRHDRLRQGESPETVMTAQLTPLGLKLLDGTVAEDEQIRF